MSQGRPAQPRLPQYQPPLPVSQVGNMQARRRIRPKTHRKLGAHCSTPQQGTPRTRAVSATNLETRALSARSRPRRACRPHQRARGLRARRRPHQKRRQPRRARRIGTLRGVLRTTTGLRNLARRTHTRRRPEDTSPNHRGTRAPSARRRRTLRVLLRRPGPPPNLAHRSQARRPPWAVPLIIHTDTRRKTLRPRPLHLRTPGLRTPRLLLRRSRAPPKPVAKMLARCPPGAGPPNNR